jgi:hypothetical protein
LFSWSAPGGVDLAFAAASEGDAAKLHIPLKMLVALSAGLCLWIVYGVLKEDWVIMLANSIGAILSLAVLGFKNSRLEFMLSQAQPNILFKRAARKSLRQRR